MEVKNLSKNKIKFIRSLEYKKTRKELNLFVAEGNKLVCDNLNSLSCESLFATQEWLDQHTQIKANEIFCITKEDMDKISFLKTPQDVLGIFKIPFYPLKIDSFKDKLSLVLDTVQDPGNLGTIIRIADWFGIEQIICSLETADCFAPKTVQATMGAIARIKIYYTPLESFFETMNDIPVYGTFLEGENIYTQPLSQNGLIIMGNEGKGIHPELRKYITSELHIPSYPVNRDTSESLNVAIATSIICSEFRRRVQ